MRYPSSLATRPSGFIVRVGLASLAFLGITAAAMTPLHAQASAAGREGPRRDLPTGREIALARSAAPAAVSAEATVMVWANGRYRVAEEGSNGVTCYVSRSWPESLEPHCFDAEGSRTILPIHVWQVEQLAAGRSNDEVVAEIDRRLASGEFLVPERPAMSWMMSAEQELISDEGQPVGAWKPHVMIYYPNMDADGMGLGAIQGVDGGVVVDAGKPLSNLMIPVEVAVPVAAGGEG